jgi:hypothetical protein
MSAPSLIFEMPQESKAPITDDVHPKTNKPKETRLDSIAVTCTRQLADDILEKSLGQAVMNYKQSVGFQIETLQMIEDIFAKATVDLKEKIPSDPHQCCYSADKNSQPKSCSSSSTEPEDLTHEGTANQRILETGLTTNIPVESLFNPRLTKTDDKRLPADAEAIKSCHRGSIENEATLASLPMPEICSDSIEAFISECDTRASDVPNDKTQSQIQDELSFLGSKPGKLFICTFDGCGKASIECSTLTSIFETVLLSLT